MKEGIRGRRSAILDVDPGIIGQGVTVGAEQRTPSLFFKLPLIGATPTLLQIHAPILEAEHGNHAIAVEDLIVSQQRRGVRIRLHAIKGAVKVSGKLAFEFEIFYVCFNADGSKIADECASLWERGHNLVLESIS